MLEKAIAFAATKHSGQLDKSGVPYILHCLSVMNKCYPNVGAMVVAVLHDTMEDTNATGAEINDLCGTYIALAVRAITKDKNEDYDAYLERVKSNQLATTVKIADLEHNMEPSRMTWDISDKDAARMAKYIRAYGMLQRHRSHMEEIGSWL